MEREPMDTRPSWRSYFLTMAEAASVRADCNRRQVGCVLVNDDNRVLATGYNGALSGEPGCMTAGACPRGQLSFEELPAFSPYDRGVGKCIANHAERNAVADAQNRGVNVFGSTAYINHEPCGPCRLLLARVGVVRAVWPMGEASL